MNYFDIRKLYTAVTGCDFEGFETVNDWTGDPVYINTVPGVVNIGRATSDPADHFNNKEYIEWCLSEYLTLQKYDKKIKANTVAGLLQEFQDAYTRVNTPAIFEVETAGNRDAWPTSINIKPQSKVKVDWGDGTTEIIESQSSNHNIIHHYTKAGKYIVKVYNLNTEHVSSPTNPFYLINRFGYPLNIVYPRLKNAIPVSFYTEDSEEGNCFLNCTKLINTAYSDYSTKFIITDKDGNPFYTFIGNGAWNNDGTVAKPTEIITPIDFTVNGKLINTNNIFNLYCNCIVKDPELLNKDISISGLEELYIQSEDLNSFKLLFDYFHSKTTHEYTLYILDGKYSDEAAEYAVSNGYEGEIEIVDRNPHSESRSRSVTNETAEEE